jgi:hypothetical protein
MHVIHAYCVGLDVHKKTISAYMSVCQADGSKRRPVRVFGAFTSDLLVLADWRKARGLREFVTPQWMLWEKRW